MKVYGIVEADGRLVEVLPFWEVDTLADAAERCGRGYIREFEEIRKMRQDGYGRLSVNLGQPRMVADVSYEPLSEVYRVWNGRLAARKERA